MNRKKTKIGFWEAVIPIVAAVMMWYGLVELANHEDVKEAAFGVVFGFLVLTGAIVRFELKDRDGKNHSDSN